MNIGSNMGFDDILKESDARRARELERAATAPLEAHARLNAFQERVTSELLDALRALGDPSIGELRVLKVTGPIGVGKRSIQIECGTSARIVLMTTISHPDGAQEATCGAIELVASRGGRKAETTLQPTEPLAYKIPNVPESSFAIDVGVLRAALGRLAREL
jgi:hypothetical protein